MECKIQDYPRLTNLNGLMTSQTKNKAKDKARKQLWDSLLEVYEKEVNTGNLSDFEEFCGDTILEWPVAHPQDDSRALLKVAQSNPHLVSSVLPGAELFIDSIEETYLHPKKKRRKTASITATPKKKRPPFKTTFAKKTISSRTNRVNSSLQAKSKKITTVKTSAKLKHSFSKKTSHCQRNIKKNSSVISKNNNKHLLCKKTNKENLKPLPIVKNNLDKLDQKCVLKSRYYSDTETASTRPDGRVFRCKLVFKLCECSESEEIF